MDQPTSQQTIASDIALHSVPNVTAATPPPNMAPSMAGQRAVSLQLAAQAAAAAANAANTVDAAANTAAESAAFVARAVFFESAAALGVYGGGLLGSYFRLRVGALGPEAWHTSVTNA